LIRGYIPVADEKDRKRSIPLEKNEIRKRDAKCLLREDGQTSTTCMIKPDLFNRQMQKKGNKKG
jgi:hypothetical protein